MSRWAKRRVGLARAASAAAHLVLAFAVLFGIVRSGGRYFYCEALGLLPFDPCVEGTGDGQGKNPTGMMLSERSADCCQIVTLSATPPAAPAVRPDIAPADCVALLPTLQPAGGIDSAASSQVDRALQRWRPPPRAAKELRAQLMVFLI